MKVFKCYSLGIKKNSSIKKSSSVNKNSDIKRDSSVKKNKKNFKSNDVTNLKDIKNYRSVKDNNRFKSLISRFYILIFCVITIGGLLIGVSLKTLVSLVPQVNFGKFDLMVDDIASYIANYNVTVVSNKNMNTYTMTEIYQNKDGVEQFYFSFIDILGNETSYSIKDGNIKISNQNQLNTFITPQVNFSKMNLLSLMTYKELINNYSEDSCYDIISYLEDELATSKTYEVIEIVIDNFERNDSHEIDNLIPKELNIEKIEIRLSGNMVVDIRIFNKGELYMEIIYTEIEINTSVSEDMIF